MIYAQYKKLSSLTINCSIPTFLSNETTTNLTEFELFQEESDLLKTGLCFSIQPNKIQKSEIFATFEKFHHLFINNLTFEEIKNQIKTHLSYLANSCFYNYKSFPHILRQPRVLKNPKKNLYKTRGNRVVFLD